MMRYEPSDWHDRRNQKRKMRVCWKSYYRTHGDEQERTWQMVFAVYALVMALCLLVYVLVFVH